MENVLFKNHLYYKVYLDKLIALNTEQIILNLNVDFVAQLHYGFAGEPLIIVSLATMEEKIMVIVLVRLVH